MKLHNKTDIYNITQLSFEIYNASIQQLYVWETLNQQTEDSCTQFKWCTDLQHLLQLILVFLKCLGTFIAKDVVISAFYRISSSSCSVYLTNVSF